MNEVERQIYQIGIIPVIAIDNADDAVPLAHALCKGGLNAAEVTFRTAAAADAIARMVDAVPDILVGAGTVLNIAQCQHAVQAGAKFIVSPGYNAELVDYCLAQGIPVLPGCANASEMTHAVNAGLELVKFFPAEPSGGLPFLKSLAPVFPKLRFMPTGGINTKNLADYLGYNRIFACGGTWMVKKDLIAGRQWDTITRVCQEAVDRMLDFTLAHVGVNCADRQQAEANANAMGALLSLSVRIDSASAFAGNAIEYMYAPGRGTCGHIAFATANIDRAEYHLRRCGIAFDDASRKTDPAGNTKAIYLADEIGGFAIHLIQK